MATNNAINNTSFIMVNASTIQQIEPGYIYNITTTDAYSFTLPITAHIGQVFGIIFIYPVSGYSNEADFTINQNANQYITKVPGTSTTVGTSGYIKSTNWFPCVYDTFICIEENNGWMRFGGGIGEYSDWA